MEYLITFIEGIASFISPCILPIIPVYISYFTGPTNNTKKSLFNALAFTSGFTIIFIVLGIFASTFGKLIAKYSSYVNIILGLFLIVISLNYMEIIFIKLFNKTKAITMKKKNLNILTSLAFGMIFSLSWTPCVGAFLSTALILASTSGRIIKGSLLLLTYSLGLAIPFILTTFFLDKLKSTFNFIKQHYSTINKIAGIIILISGLYNIIQGIIEIIN